MISKQKFLKINDVIRTSGGFIRFYATDVPVEHVLAMAPQGFQRVLCCCEGGDFALTFLGSKPGVKVFAFDLCPAQLFLLAAKTKLIETTKIEHFNPSLNLFTRLYKGRIQPLPRIISQL